METNIVVVIFASYPKAMERVLGANEGLRRRVTKFFKFNNLSTEDMAQVLCVKMEEHKVGTFPHGFKLSKECTLEAIVELLESNTTKKKRKSLNGGLVGFSL